jgi:hypothetical protein
MKRFPESEWLKIPDASQAFGLPIDELSRACQAREILCVEITLSGRGGKLLRLINRASLDEYVRSYLPGGARYQKAVALEVATV